ncbi:MAG: ribonuclease P protein component [Cellvibrionaceae bacterium]|nr:ribonuclease P protein component [Cellvibrionaceae bacterium]MCV6627465.1 ribonuclease P protein component [Cellvibrionaceae bacterium]
MSQNYSLSQSYGFDKSLRLLSPSDFKPVFDSCDTRASHQHFLILAKRNNLGRPRLGLVIAKKNVRLAVERNRLKRLIRESFRLQQHQLPPIDAIVLARRGMGELDNAALTRQLNKQWQRLARKLTADQSSETGSETKNNPGN